MSLRGYLSLLWLPQQNTMDWVAYNVSNFFLTLWRLEVQDQGANLIGFWWRPSSWLQPADFSLFPHMVEGPRELCRVSFTGALIPFMGTPPSWSNHPQRPHLPVPPLRGLGFQHMNFGGGVTNIQTTAVGYLVCLCQTPYNVCYMLKGFMCIFNCNLHCIFILINYRSTYLLNLSTMSVALTRKSF